MWLFYFPICIVNQFTPTNIYINLNLVQAAKNTKALEATKNNLAKQVKDLISSLEDEKRMRVIYLFIVNENVKA